MGSVKTVWGIDIGQCALKALKLRIIEGELRAEAFDIIEHPRILSQPEADRDQLMRNALEQFLARNNVSGSMVVISAPGQSGFTRFVKLPPVEVKQVPEIVRFEAEQQIPFEISEVIWRWQAFMDPDSPDIEVGIFAMKRTDVGDVLDRFEEVQIDVDAVQMAPLALYNFADFDGQKAEDGATLVVDVGADKTDLVVADGPRIWTRTLQLGGNNFTAALVKAFKLSFTKAEKLKRTAATSKYARQIFQAMRPVFAELVQEIQRSIGYYTSLHRESRFKRVVGLGNGFRLPGLQKFLEQNLAIPVVRADSYNRLPASAVVNAPAFAENVLSFAVAYGLALQGLGLTKIQTNLLPAEIARKRLWARKRPWFAAAAALVLAALAGWAARVKVDSTRLDPNRPLPHWEPTLAAAESLLTQRDEVSGRPGNMILREIDTFVASCRALRAEHRRRQGLDQAEEKRIKDYQNMLAFRGLWVELHYMISEAVRKVATDQPLMNEENVERLKKVARPLRKVVMIESIRADYYEDVANLTTRDLEQLQPGQGGRFLRPQVRGAPRAVGGAGQPTVAAGKPRQRGFVIFVTGKTPLPQAAAGRFLNDIKEGLRDAAKGFPSVEYVAGVRYFLGTLGRKALGGYRGGYAPTGPDGKELAVLDPLTEEDASKDKDFRIVWAVAIKEPPVPVPEISPGGKGGVK